MTMMLNESVQPLQHMCLIRLEKIEKKTTGGIHLPEQTIDRQQGGKIHAELLKAGPTAFTEERFGEVAPEIGDVVVVKRYAGQAAVTDAWEDDGAEYQLISADDILGIVGAVA